jgi:hypothetical protein
MQTVLAPAQAPLRLKKVLPERLRALGLDEMWLQNQTDWWNLAKIIPLQFHPDTFQSLDEIVRRDDGQEDRERVGIQHGLFRMNSRRKLVIGVSVAIFYFLVLCLDVLTRLSQSHTSPVAATSAQLWELVLSDMLVITFAFALAGFGITVLYVAAHFVKKYW